MTAEMGRALAELGAGAAADATYILGRETYVATLRNKMGAVSESIFEVLSRNARKPTDHFNIPPEQVVELGTYIDLRGRAKCPAPRSGAAQIARSGLPSPTLAALARPVLPFPSVSLVELKNTDRASLTAALTAIERVEKLSALRSLAVHALAVVGVVLWLGLAFPARLPAGLLRYALALFAALAVGAAVTLVLERRGLRTQRRLLDQEP